MKQKDIALIAGVALITAIISLVISGALFGSPNKNPIKIPVLTKISPDFPSPSSDDNYKKFFNAQANNPTKLIEIGNNNNSTPFQGTNQ